MKLLPIVGSSMIASLGYTQDTETMVVQFQNGVFYRYDGVPKDNYLGVIGNQESYGRAFNELVKKPGFNTEIVDAEAVLAL